MALSALAPRDDEGRMWEATLQHRFGGSGALAGHAVGNMLIAGLYDILQSEVAALDVVAKLIRAEGRVLPVCEQPLEIEAEVGGLDADPASCGKSAAKSQSPQPSDRYAAPASCQKTP